MMGILDRLGDKAVEKITKRETIRLPFDQMAQLVQDWFIAKADDEYLEAVGRTAKCAGVFPVRKMTSKDEKYNWRVEKLRWSIFDVIRGRRKVVWILDVDAKKFYQLDKDKDWKKFYNAVDTAIKMEKVNRNKSE